MIAMRPAIAAVAFDVDGVLTDGTVWLGIDREELKRVSFADIMGVSLARRAGIRLALISGEGGVPFDRIAAKFGITDVWAGCKDKASALGEFAARAGVPVAQVCFVGDDVNDVEAMKLAGLSAAPSTAHQSALDVAQWRLRSPAGGGAARELLDALSAAAFDPEVALAASRK